MQGELIELSRRWRLGAQIGDPSGFGQVYLASAEDDHSEADIKLVHKEPRAKREMLFDLPDVKNVIPILDKGEWGDYYVIVMPKAETSLAKYVEAAGGGLTSVDAVPVLGDVFEALADLAARSDPIVHRDIKLENVLLWDGHWCLADFGIARYAEAATDSETFKYMGTREYHPPERWRGERATTASDIYSAGVMAYRMLAGRFPFEGPDFGEQHVRQEPPTLTGLPPNLAAVVVECLYKRPEARPSAANLVQRLSRVLEPTSAVGARLQAIHRGMIEERAREDARSVSAQSNLERRADLAKAAEASLLRIGQMLQDRVLQDAPTASHDPTSRTLGWSLALSIATLSMEPFAPTSETSFGSSPPPFEVVGFSSVAVRIPPNMYEYVGRSHSLWFCDAQEKGVFRWYETAFSMGGFSGLRSAIDPFAMVPSPEAGRAVLSGGLDDHRITRPFVPIDQGDEGHFVDEWLDWLATAAEGNLEMPHQSPEIDPAGSFRRQ